MVDELSLFHPRLAGAQTFLNQSQVSVVAVAPSSPARNAIEELEETARLHLLLAGHRVRTLTPAQVDELRSRFG